VDQEEEEKGEPALLVSVGPCSSRVKEDYWRACGSVPGFYLTMLRGLTWGRGEGRRREKKEGRERKASGSFSV